MIVDLRQAYDDDGAGTLRLVGELWNGYGSTRGPITVTAKLYDSDGHLLATRARPDAPVRDQPTRTPFSIGGSLPDGFASVKYTSSAPAPGSSRRGRLRPRDRLQRGVQPMAGPRPAQGHQRAVTDLKMMLTLYDTHGNVVDVVRGSDPVDDAR